MQKLAYRISAGLGVKCTPEENTKDYGIAKNYEITKPIDTLYNYIYNINLGMVAWSWKYNTGRKNIFSSKTRYFKGYQSVMWVQRQELTTLYLLYSFTSK